MHTTKTSGGTIFHHDGDYKGTVKIQVKSSQIENDTSFGVSYIDIPAEDLISYVADYIRSERISSLESASDEEILGIPK